jgi:dTDP-4-amino-4,6-dideoxygalactose transaminase
MNIISKYYSENINSNFIKPYVPKKYFSSWAQYSLVLSDKKFRDETIIQLKEEGIPSMIYYRIPLHLQKVFRFLENIKGDFPFSENISDTILSLPMHPYLNKDDQNKIIEKLNSIIF